jgi:hypothetical protein
VPDVRERPEVLFAHQDGAATSVLETSGTAVVVRVLTRWTDLVEAMVEVVAGAREQLVVTGSRREAAVGLVHHGREACASARPVETIEAVRALPVRHN